MLKLRVPYRVKKFLSEHKVKYIQDYTEREFRAILKTPPIISHNDADVEVHSLLDHNFLIYYLLAIKSLMHFSKTRFSIYCHCCQPNMTVEDVSILRQHIQGVNFIERDEADSRMKQLLRPYKTCYEQRINNLAIIGTSGKFFDQMFFSRTKKLVLMDADTIFFKTPLEIDAWASGDGSRSLHLKDKVNWFCIPYPRINEVNGLPKVKPLFNAGLLCFDKSPLVENMNRVEEIMSIIDAEKGDFSGLDQTVFALMLPDQVQLPDESYTCDFTRRVASDGNITFKHYIGRNNRFGNFLYCQEGNSVIRQLMRAGTK